MDYKYETENYDPEYIKKLALKSLGGIKGVLGIFIDESFRSSIDYKKVTCIRIFVNDLRKNDLIEDINSKLDGLPLPYIICAKDQEWRPSLGFLDFVMKYRSSDGCRVGLDESSIGEVVCGTKKGKIIYEALKNTKSGMTGMNLETDYFVCDTIKRRNKR